MEARAALSGAPVTRLSPLGRAAVLLVRRYQTRDARSGPPSCRYRPTCSAYAVASIERYGLLVGGARSVRRILRCRPPFGGVDEP
ncbi:MAG TPA: membrane protein insertion efficiency factor YidD [Actinomycetes bacterium]|nr:membrane protein insertion efficiency factor YidD [Actinomycetes bacterium]